MTHYTRSKVDPQFLAGADRRGGRRRRRWSPPWREANTARHAYELWEAAGRSTAAPRPAVREGGGQPRAPTSRTAIAVDAIMVDFEGAHVVGASPGAREPRGGGGARRDRRARRGRRRRSRRASAEAAGARDARRRRPRHLAALAPPGAEQVALDGDARAGARRARGRTTAPACVLASRRPRLLRHRPRAGRARRRRARSTCAPRRRRWRVAFARLGLAVGRRARGQRATAATRAPALDAALRHPKVAILTAPAAPPALVRRAPAPAAAARWRWPSASATPTSAWCAARPRRSRGDRSPSPTCSSSSIRRAPATGARGSGRRARRPAGRCPTTPSSTAPG